MSQLGGPGWLHHQKSLYPYTTAATRHESAFPEVGVASGSLETLISVHDKGHIGVLSFQSPDIHALDEHPYHNKAQGCLIRESTVPVTPLIVLTLSISLLDLYLAEGAGHQ